MAVLSLLVVLIAQMVNSAAGTTKLSRKRIDADNEARRIFDRMEADFSGMLDRPDADFLIKKLSGNDEFDFFSDAPAYLGGNASQQPVSLIGYRVNSAQQIERLGRGLAWDSPPPAGPVFLTLNGATPLAASTIEGAYNTVLADNDNFYVMGEGVFRLEIDFLLKPKSGAAAKFSTSPFRSGGTSPFSNQGAGLSDVQAIVVTLAILDTESRKLVSGLSGLPAKFEDTTEGTTPAAAWQAKAEHPADLGIPAAAASQVRIYQRIFPMNKPISLTP